MRKILVPLIICIVGTIVFRNVPRREVHNSAIIYVLRKIMRMLEWIGYRFLAWSAWILDRFGRHSNSDDVTSITL